jgi:Mg-chelatase subunit ChlI
LVILKTSRAHAAFEGRTAINERDIALAAELALPHRIRQGPFHQSSVTPDQLAERIDQLQGASAMAGEPQPSEEKESSPEKKKT